MVSFLLVLTALFSSAHADTVRVGDAFETDTAHFVTQKISECQDQEEQAAMVTDRFTVWNNDAVMANIIAMDSSDGEKMSCQTKQKIRLGLGITKIALTAASVGAMCSTILAPFGVVIAGANAGTQFLDFIVDKMECFDKEASERNKQLIKQQVCEAFIKKGVECDPSSL